MCLIYWIYFCKYWFIVFLDKVVKTRRFDLDMILVKKTSSPWSVDDVPNMMLQALPRFDV